MNRRKLFWAKVNKRGPKMPHMRTRCWVWTGAIDKRYGYGFFHCPEMTPEGKRSSLHAAHRVAWFFKKGRAPVEHVLHRCDNPPCVRHLFEGDHADNMRDRAKKGRQPKGYRRESQRVCSDEIAEKVRRRLAAGEKGTDLAKEYGLNLNTLYALKRRNP